MAVKRNKGLGRGLDALLGDFKGENQVPSENRDDDSVVQSVDIRLLDNNPDQPRKAFDEIKLMELAESIKLHGIFQPILVVRNGERYTIVAGERRFRAARKAGLNEVPVIVRKLGEVEMLEIALIENIQRENLNPIEEARAIKQLIEEYDLTQEEVAQRIGWHRSSVANSLRLLSLSGMLQEYLQDGRLKEGHGKILLGIQDKKLRDELGQKAALQNWSVRELIEKSSPEKKAANLKAKSDSQEKAPRSANSYDPIISPIEEDLRNSLAMKVMIQGDDKRGKLIIDYCSSQELEALYTLLSVGLKGYEPNA